VDDCFGHKLLIAALKGQGFEVVGMHDGFGKEQNLKDEKIIPYCAKRKFLIATTDKNMVLRHRELLNKHRQCIIFTTNNNSDNLSKWLPGFVKNKAKILRTWKKRQPPWVGRLHPSGHLEIFDLMRYAEYDPETKNKRRR
jgi:predicted nuclease of predicted toxin-antitoxin system